MKQYSSAEMLEHLNKVERIAGLTKTGRLMRDPFRYARAIVFKEWIYPKRKTPKTITTPLFFGETITVALPAATDIYLTGGKSHLSEIKLARFLIKHLKAGDQFFDIGAHFGYFSMLATALVGEGGKVTSFEPGDSTFALLEQNVQQLKQVTVHKVAVSDEPGVIDFFEFPNLHSEYNTTDVSQFESEAWFQQEAPKKKSVSATTIDEMVRKQGLAPDVIKIDVEGAESKVIRGGLTYFRNSHPVVIMEYLEAARGNESHQRATNMLTGEGYAAYTIGRDGSLEKVDNIEEHLYSNKLESDNIVFMKNTR